MFQSRLIKHAIVNITIIVTKSKNLICFYINFKNYEKIAILKILKI